VLLPELEGVWTIGPTHSLQGVQPLAVLPSGATLRLPLPPNVVRRRYFVQPFCVKAAGGVRVATPLHTLVLNPDTGPDCNNNGLQDYLEVVLGLVPDANHNLIPDTCPGG